MTALPAWAQSPEARAVIDRILNERPGTFIRSGTWIEGGGVARFSGFTAGRLRGIYNAWWNANYEGATSLPEQPDDLIARLLDEHSLVEVEHLGPGRIAA